MMFEQKNLGNRAVSLELLIEVEKRQPKVILEIGAGSGTRELRKMARVISIEQAEKYCKMLTPDIGENEIHHVPLEKKTGWYDVERLKEVLQGKEYDMILVDGPERVCRDGFLKNIELFNKDAVMIIDDTHREGMGEMIRGLRQVLERRPLEHKAKNRVKFTIFEKKYGT
jgi:predicted O-methyltransferase YrrM